MAPKAPQQHHPGRRRPVRGLPRIPLLERQPRTFLPETPGRRRHQTAPRKFRAAHSQPPRFRAAPQRRAHSGLPKLPACAALGPRRHRFGNRAQCRARPVGRRHAGPAGADLGASPRPGAAPRFSRRNHRSPPPHPSAPGRRSGGARTVVPGPGARAVSPPGGRAQPPAGQRR